MFSFKSFISLAFAAVFAVLYLQASVAHAEDKPNPVVASVTQVNINTADAETIAKNLKGVGIKKAEAIVQYRKNYGPFHDIEELIEVKGIGKSTLDKNAGMIITN